MFRCLLIKSLPASFGRHYAAQITRFLLWHLSLCVCLFIGIFFSSSVNSWRSCLYLISLPWLLFTYLLCFSHRYFIHDLFFFLSLSLSRIAPKVNAAFKNSFSINWFGCCCFLARSDYVVSLYFILYILLTFFCLQRLRPVTVDVILQLLRQNKATQSKWITRIACLIPITLFLWFI